MEETDISEDVSLSASTVTPSLVYDDEAGFAQQLKSHFQHLENNPVTDSWLLQLVVLCEASHFNFVYTQSLLMRLAEKSIPHSSIALAISQQLNDRFHHHGQETQTMILNFQWPEHIVVFPSLSVRAAPFDKDIRETLLTLSAEAGNGKMASAGDFMKIKNKYSEATPPSIKYLRDPRIFETFCTEIIGTDPRIDDKLFLLSYASCYVDGLPPAELKKARDKTSQDIKTFLNVFAKIKGPADLKGQDFMKLLELALEHPVISMSLILKSVRLGLLQPISIRHDTELNKTPAIFDMFDEIATQRPLSRPQIFKCYTDVLKTKYSPDTLTLEEESEFKKKILDQILYLVRIGYSQHVLDYIARTVNTRDESLTIYFIVRFLEILGPTSSKSSTVINITLNLVQNLTSNLLIRDESALVTYYESLRDMLDTFNDDHHIGIRDLIENVYGKFKDVPVVNASNRRGSSGGHDDDDFHVPSAEEDVSSSEEEEEQQQEEEEDGEDEPMQGEHHHMVSSEGDNVMPGARGARTVYDEQDVIVITM
ncbi:hypothetical protein SmJEL517_g05114 [Synchytrium microbalum]|uniref:Uncharacterized protein n=1 Tax=Synchytrium microbalum TaxID=1806994 RepID=A0A507BWP4_9FUNG|nr:uncharacterized protein SmJEL517_g05114 [Synchytrium microbalum]TPX31578.1 hypothetical protein SmJEL517_g05114 [Synchytrium microbalum]